MDIDLLLEQVLYEAAELNIPYSNRILPPVINLRAKSRFGCCKKTNHGFIIEVSFLLLSCNEKSVKEVIAHEVLHTCEGCYNHSPLWKIYAAKMNQAYGYSIKRTSSKEELGIPVEFRKKKDPQIKYRIQCIACGAVFERQRVSKLVTQPHLYRCKCGGKLKRIL